MINTTEVTSVSCDFCGVLLETSEGYKDEGQYYKAHEVIALNNILKVVVDNDLCEECFRAELIIWLNSSTLIEE